MIEPYRRRGGKMAEVMMDQLFPWLNYGPQVFTIFRILLWRIGSDRRFLFVVLRKELEGWKHIG